MEDLHGAQFTLAGNDVYAIDAPETLPDAPVTAVMHWIAREAGVSWGGLKYVEMRLSVHQNCTVDGDCPAVSDVELCAYRDCVPGWDQGAREARGWCRKGWCAPVDARAHTYDLATRAWCASRVPFSRLRDPRRPAVQDAIDAPLRHRRDSSARRALPLMLKEGRFPSLHQKRRLEELVGRMRCEAPEDRPSLSDVLAALAGRPVPSIVEGN